MKQSSLACLAMVTVTVGILLSAGADPRGEPVPSSGTLPRKVKDVKPVYPTASLAAGDEGAVGIELKITAAGVVSEAIVVWSTCPRLNSAAQAAARAWRFEAPTINGTPAALRTMTWVPFRLPATLKSRAGRPGSCIWVDPPRPIH